MALPPVKTTNVNPASTLTEVLGNFNGGGIANVGRMPIAAFIAQLIAQAPLSTTLADIYAQLATLAAATGDPEAIAEFNAQLEALAPLGDMLKTGSADDIVLSVEDQNGYLAAFLTLAGGFATNSFQINTQVSGQSFLVTDPLGFTLMDISSSGQTLPSGARYQVDYADAGAVFSICDGWGFLSFQSRGDGTLIGKASGASSGGSDIGQRNARALALAQAALSQTSNCSRFYWQINHVISYGQSLEIGAEAYPTFTIKQYGNLMLGDSVRSQFQSGTTYEVVGTTQLNPLVATAQAQNSGTLLDLTAQMAIPNGDANSPRGITPAEGAVSMAKWLWMQSKGVLTDTSQVLIPTCNGRGATGVTALSKGASPEYYGKVPDGASKIKTLADAASKTYGVPAILWVQGENNYSLGTSKADYKAALKQLRADIILDVCVGIAGQEQQPAMITYQTGGTYTSDANNLAVAMAQLELCLEEPDWYLACPSYPVTNKSSGHLNSNGSLWLGLQMGKVLHRVCVLGKSWRPLYPLQATHSGLTVLVDFHVPSPPLTFDLPYEVDAATDYAGKGFRVMDEIGDIAFVPSIAADAIVRLDLARPPVGAVHLRYAGKATYNGNGCLRDSDAMLSSELYSEIAAGGAYSEINPAALVGKPFPLHNWCVAFDIPVTAI